MDLDGTPPKYLAIKNWEKYQVVQHGKPAPWCKLYSRLLDSTRFLRWSWTTRGVVLGLLALRTRLDRNLPGDVHVLARMLSADGRQAVDVHQAVTRLTSDGFLILTNQQNGYENSGAEKSRVEKRREEEKKIRRAPQKTAATPLAFALPSWVPVSTWNDYSEMRRKIRHPMTRAAMTLAVHKLGTLSGSNPDLARSILEQSILNSWQGLFELRPNGGANGASKRKRYTREEIERLSEPAYQESD